MGVTAAGPWKDPWRDARDEKGTAKYVDTSALLKVSKDGGQGKTGGAVFAVHLHIFDHLRFNQFPFET